MGPSPAGELAAEAERLLRKSITLNSNFWESEFELSIMLEIKPEFRAAASTSEAGSSAESQGARTTLSTCKGL